MPDQGTIGVDIEQTEAGAVARLTLLRGDKRNALSPSMIAELRTAALTLAARDDLRCVLLSGQGSTFCAGADVTMLAGLTPATAREMITDLHRAIDAVRRLPVPVIAMLRGACLGAGMELAAACDMRIADDKLMVGMPEVRVGIPSVIEASLLPRLIGWGHAADLLMTGRTIGADEALRIGFVEAVAPISDMITLLTPRLDGILSSAPGAVRAQKAIMQAWEADESTGRTVSIDAFAAAYETDEPARYLARFAK